MISGDGQCLVEGGFQRQHARTECAALLTEGDEAPIVEVFDRAVGRQSRGDLGDTAKDSVAAELGVENIDMRDAIQQRQNSAVVANRAFDGLDSRRQIVSLAS